ncbi:ABC transporter ATP-binding protein [Comamonas aquatica]|jgi:sn-glycerol 3-phosphate transport system ATP-binding protein|uniref:Sn-glycerol-3-phosphate import ATP-binding protein UgpC n=1 Tax=Comamonas aquatica TaxID=225991 RepID=A0AA35D4U4_9BURK|nr:ABC transporter ATP-binding protein [Comamonas aquatica]CAB5657205.1 sn-glycerol-3-phosphate import ATP-binding protein UgpC [Comamonas aquatica]CAB5665662.1 sn-glycerol-3-phosphate import ATP-binding protein UgpC [Comamonas aquatica]CAC9225421.1 sn-glycerol-3-phosphate import ATP-binding protein UgpC [Comamonas aquatica]CAC9683053.1 sn-glycerol-3-phosphate import ATP-binding protein UgpC [Comamonas aquatica]
MSTIQLEGVAKSWGSTTALQAIDLSIPSGAFCVLLGPSGCGKSTTLRIIAGLEQASAGRVRIGGQDVTDLPPAERGIAMVFQNYALFPHLSVAENIGFGLSVRKVPKAEAARRLHDAAGLLGLSHLLGRKPGQLSGGQQQRVALGRALVAQAHVCLMDEPLSNLDAQLRQEMRAELRELQQRLGLTVVYVTHDQAEAMSMADQVVLLHQGRVEQCATPRALYAQPATTFAARFIGTPAMNLVQLQDGAIAGSSVRLPAPTGAAWLGLRPEAVALSGEARVPAQVVGLEYLGADVVLRCQVGSEQITVRAPGQQAVQAGQALPLAWPPQAMHFFDAAGQRLA